MSDDNFDGDEGIKNLRAAHDKQAAELRELKKALEGYQQKERTNGLASIFKAKGLKESAISHYSGDVSEDAVEKWATDLGLLSASEQEENDANSEAAARAALATGGSQSLPAMSPGTNGPVIADPFKALELMQTPGFSYEDGVRLGIFPPDPNVVGKVG